MPRGRPLPVLPPDFADPGLPSGTLSYSSYSLYQHCGRAYEFAKIRRVPAPTRASAMAGQVFHHGAELANQHVHAYGQAPLRARILAEVADAFDAERPETVFEADDDPGALKDATLAAYATFHDRVLPHVRPVGVEHFFAVRVGTVPVIGYVDLIDYDVATRERVVVDYKFTARTWAQRQADRSPQLTLYAHALGVTAGRIDNFVRLASGVKHTSRPTLRTIGDVANLTEHFEETAADIKAGRFPMAPLDSWACTARYCAYYEMCRGARR